MATFPIERAPERLGATPTTAVRANIDVSAGGQELGRAVAGFGEAVFGLGQKYQAINDNRDVANGIAAYNNLVNTYNESLASKDPDEYVPGFEALQSQIDAISKTGSSRAQESLKNRFAIWNEANRSSIALLALKNRTIQAKNEIPRNLAVFAKAKQDTEAKAYINGFSEILNPEERAFWKLQYQDMRDENRIFEATNLAADSPTPQNLKLARQIIDKYSKDDRERYANLQRLRGLQKQKSVLRDATYKALINKQVNDMVSAFSAGNMYQGDVHDDIEPIYNQFSQRFANDTLDASDDITFDSMQEELLKGEHYDIIELASAYSSGLSTEQYVDIVKKNAENAKLTPKQLENLRTFSAYITTKYNKIMLGVRNKLSPTTAPEVMTAVYSDTLEVKNMVKAEILKGTPTTEIYELVEKHFIADTDRFVKNWFANLFLPKSYEIVEEIRELGDRQERHDVILDFIKSGEKEDIKRLMKLLNKWYD